MRRENNAPPALELGAAGRTRSDQTGGERLHIGSSHLLLGGFVRGRNETAGGGPEGELK